MTTREEVRSPEAPEPIGPYSQAIAWDDLVLCSGQIALKDGRLQGEDATEQARIAFANLRSVLQAAGCGVGDILRTTLYLVDMADFAAVNEVYAEMLAVPGTPPPARSTVAVAQLPKGARVEVDAIACRTR